MSMGEDDRQVEVLTREQLQEEAKELPPDALVVGGLTRTRMVQGDCFRPAAAEALKCKCTTTVYTSGHTIYMKEVCVADEHEFVITSTEIGSV
jgi:hypothetical protein